MTDTQRKLAQVRSILAERQLDAVLIKRICNFAWLTDGAANYVGLAADVGAAMLLVTRDAQYVVTTNIEAARLAAEEPLAALGFELRPTPWHTPAAALAGLTAGLRLGADAPHPGAADLSEEFNRLRLHLTSVEGERLRGLGLACGRAMDAAIRRVRPGMTEYKIAGLLSQSAYAQGVVPIVNLIATDERIFRFRHPLPTERRLEKYAMLVLCGRREGLVASITRLIYFGALPDELRRKQEACARIDATFIGRTRPGARVAEILQAGIAAYAATGYGDEWQLHHQGGAAGYQAREYLATPTTTETVHEGQAFAWNPSITGVKSEDTILVGPETNEVLTAIPDWPTIAVEVDGRVWERPAILEVR